MNPCNEEGTCNFTTIGGILELFGIAVCKRGIYRLQHSAQIQPNGEISYVSKYWANLLHFTNYADFVTNFKLYTCTQKGNTGFQQINRNTKP